MPTVNHGPEALPVGVPEMAAPAEHLITEPVTAAKGAEQRSDAEPAAPAAKYEHRETGAKPRARGRTKLIDCLVMRENVGGLGNCLRLV
jgi:hypothetical protein